MPRMSSYWRAATRVVQAGRQSSSPVKLTTQQSSGAAVLLQLGQHLPAVDPAQGLAPQAGRAAGLAALSPEQGRAAQGRLRASLLLSLHGTVASDNCPVNRTNLRQQMRQSSTVVPGALARALARQASRHLFPALGVLSFLVCALQPTKLFCYA